MKALKSFAGRWQPRCAGNGVAALLLLHALMAPAQNSQFFFDASGNLLVETGESSTLPQILRQPQSQVVQPGDTASFSVVASDTRGLSYQWWFNGNSVPGATDATLLLSNVSSNNEGSYFVVLVNGSGNRTSAPAGLYLDSDGDGLPDAWEIAHFGNLNQSASGDYDGDGVSNLQEYLDGTDPTDPNSVLYRLTVLSDGGQVTVLPNQTAYTNGQSVTLTATNYFAYDLFRGWTGDTNTFSPVISLVMTTNKSVFAHFGYYDITWTNTLSGVWAAATNWSPNYVPTTNDNVFINGNMTVTLDGYAECGSLTLGASGSPNLAGAGTLLVHTRLDWSGGAMIGGGTTIIAPGATLNINSPSSVTLNPRTLENAGTALWTGPGPILLGSGSVLTNRQGAVFEAQTSAGWPVYLGGVNRFDNVGTFRKTTDTGTLITSGCSVNNYNTLDLQSGTLQVATGGFNSGAMTVAAGATLDLSSGTFTAVPAASLTGAGNLRISGGTATLDGLVNLTGTHTFTGGTANLIGAYICTNTTLVISGGTANFNGNSLITPTTLNLSNGNLGGTNPVTVLAQMNFTGGAMIGGGKTLVAPGATASINSSSSVSLNPRLLENAGTMVWAGAGPVLFGNGTVLTNRSGAVFEAQTSAGFPFYLGGVNRFDNAGTFRKTIDPGTFNTHGCAFNNYNTVDLESGSLQVDNGGFNAGAILVAANATLDFSSATFMASPAGSITGQGNLRVSGATATLDGLVNLTGTHTYAGGTANLIGAYICTNNTLVISGGTAFVNGNSVATPATLNLSSGNLGGTNPVTVISQMNFTGGAMISGGKTLVALGATATINSSSSVTLNPRLLENAGTTVWAGPGPIFFGNGAVLTNRPGAVFEAQTAAGWPFSLGGANRFDNAGTFRKTSSTGTLSVSGASFNNYGTLDVETGIFALNSGYSCTPGSTLLALISGASVGTGYGQLQVSGTVTLTGALALMLTNHYVPAPNTSFTVLTAGTRSGTFGSFSYPTNLGVVLSNTPNSVVLTITNISGAPVMADLPATNVFYAGRLISLSTTVGGSQPLSYQWNRNGSPLVDGSRISGSQSGALFVTNATAALDTGSYQLLVTNSQGSATSTVEVVTVQAVPKLNAGGAGWTLQGTTLPPMNSNSVTLTAGLGSTARSAFYNAPLYIGSFLASFIYQDVSGGADGIAFCLQNDPHGASALGSTGGGLGYYGITPSVALGLNIYSPNTPGISWLQNGALPPSGRYTSTTPVNVASGNPIYVSLVYTSGVLNATLVESNTTHVFTTNLPVNLPGTLGGQTAYVGFTGGDGGVASTQVVSNFTFVPLTSIAVDRTVPTAPVLWWPGVIGGYTLQTRSNLVPVADVWQNATNPVNLLNGRNQATIAPANGSQVYRLSINPAN